tara:strand:- start:1804 stop:2040 length:237 start_codon:yes stop_codon:yes gene_type:complete
MKGYTRKEIVQEIKTFNNAAFNDMNLIRDINKEVTGLNVQFEGTKFAVEGIERLFGKVAKEGFGGFRITFNYTNRKFV